MTFPAYSVNDDAPPRGFLYPQSSGLPQTIPQGIPTTSENYIHASEVVILEPQSFAEIPTAVQVIRNNKVVVLNLAHMGYEDAQRSVDFIAGGAYMCQGCLEKIDTSIFLFTPRHTHVRIATNQSKEMPNGYPDTPSHSPQQAFSRRPNPHPWNHQVS